MKKRRLGWTLALLTIAALATVGFMATRSSQTTPAADTQAAPPATVTKPTAEQDTSDKQYSITDPASPWVVVNKRRQLQPIDYEPKLIDPPVGLNQAAGSENMKVAAIISPSLEQMFSAAKQDGLQLSLASGYRSYRTQASVYAREVANNGQASADQVSARPGHSEHQTGLSADVSPGDKRCVIEECFGQTDEGIWVRDNAWRYGFIIRYPEGKTPITGYAYEPWHVRYVGKELAQKLHEAKVETLEEWFKLEAAPGY